MQSNSGSHRHNLQAIAHRAMLDRGLEPDFPPAAQAEAAHLDSSAVPPASTRDLRQLLWSSIDNDDSRDLDQIEPLAVGIGARLFGRLDPELLSFLTDQPYPRHANRVVDARLRLRPARRFPRTSPRPQMSRTKLVCASCSPNCS